MSLTQINFHYHQPWCVLKIPENRVSFEFMRQFYLLQYFLHFNSVYFCCNFEITMLERDIIEYLECRTHFCTYSQQLMMTSPITGFCTCY